jgi:hypothetical protein
MRLFERAGREVVLGVAGCSFCSYFGLFVVSIMLSAESSGRFEIQKS